MELFGIRKLLNRVFSLNNNFASLDFYKTESIKKAQFTITYKISLYFWPYVKTSKCINHFKSNGTVWSNHAKIKWISIKTTLQTNLRHKFKINDRENGLSLDTCSLYNTFYNYYFTWLLIVILSVLMVIRNIMHCV